MSKSRVLHVRLDPDDLKKVYKAAFRADRKPSDWIRRALVRAAEDQLRAVPGVKP